MKNEPASCWFFIASNLSIAFVNYISIINRFGLLYRQCRRCLLIDDMGYQMALAFEIDSLDGVDESVKTLYKEHNGKFRLDVTGIDPADELKSALKNEREERKAAKARAEQLEREKAEAEEVRLREKSEFKESYNFV